MVAEEITVVITDVEGSTELWEDDYELMTHAQEMHDSILRSLIGRYCGYEVWYRVYALPGARQAGFCGGGRQEKREKLLLL